jgi:hypothetical protein
MLSSVRISSLPRPTREKTFRIDSGVPLVPSWLLHSRFIRREDLLNAPAPLGLLISADFVDLDGTNGRVPIYE